MESENLYYGTPEPHSDKGLTCPRFWSSHKLVLRGSCTSEPSHAGPKETTGVGETPVSRSIARRRRTVWEGEVRPLRSTSGPHATSMSVGLIVRRSWAHWIHSATTAALCQPRSPVPPALAE